MTKKKVKPTKDIVALWHARSCWLDGMPATVTGRHNLNATIITCDGVHMLTLPWPDVDDVMRDDAQFGEKCDAKRKITFIVLDRFEQPLETSKKDGFLVFTDREEACTEGRNTFGKGEFIIKEFNQFKKTETYRRLVRKHTTLLRMREFKKKK